MAKSSQRRIGDFTVVGELAGKGGQGRLFSATCDRDGAFPGLSAGQVVALKVMPVRGDDPDKAYRRLKRRTDALVASRHAGIVRYWGCFAQEGGLGEDMHVVVMELLRGETLEERLRREPLGLDAAEALHVVRTCLEALVCAAGHGIVHRDIKPSNVFLCEDGGVKLIDFEIAQAAASAQTTTESGAMQGTYDYMAPDFHPDFRPDPKFRGDACSDVFSLSVLFHEALTGRRPYSTRGGAVGDQSMMEFFRRWNKADSREVARMVHVDALRVHALRHVQKVLKKGLSPDRAGRFRTYAEMLEALSAVTVRELRGGKDTYRLSVCVGKGGFGAVYKAWRGSDGSPVAVKFLTRADSDGRFWREARTLERFHDSRIVSFVESFEVGRETRMPVLVMSFLPHMPGSSLKERLAEADHRDGLPAREVIPAFVRFAEGLAILHREGVVHRDIKPANLYLPAGEPEKACLMDLGIVRTDETQTNGGLPGTPDYMAPELARSATRGDARSDIYSLGICLFEALSGTTAYPRLPRGSEAYAAWFERARSGEKPDLSALDWYPEARKAIARLVELDPADRASSAAKVAALIRALPERERVVVQTETEIVGGDAVADGTNIFDESTDDLLGDRGRESAREPEDASSGRGRAESSGGSGGGGGVSGGGDEVPGRVAGDSGRGGEAERTPQSRVDAGEAPPEVVAEKQGAEPEGESEATEAGTVVPPAVPEGATAVADGGTVAPTAVADGGTVAPTAVADGGTVAPTAVVDGGTVAPTAVVDGGTVAPTAVVDGGTVAPTAVADGGTVAPTVVADGGTVAPTVAPTVSGTISAVGMHPDVARSTGGTVRPRRGAGVREVREKSNLPAAIVVGIICIFAVVVVWYVQKHLEAQDNAPPEQQWQPEPVSEDEAEQEARRKAEEERIAAEKAAEAERIRKAEDARRKAEEERIAAEKAAEAERIRKAEEARRKAEEERIAAEKAAEAERIRKAEEARRKAEEERIAAEKAAEAERIRKAEEARRKAEEERIAAEKAAEAERIRKAEERRKAAVGVFSDEAGRIADAAKMLLDDVAKAWTEEDIVVCKRGLENLRESGGAAREDALRIQGVSGDRSFTDAANRMEKAIADLANLISRQETAIAERIAAERRAAEEAERRRRAAEEAERRRKEELERRQREEYAAIEGSIAQIFGREAYDRAVRAVSEKRGDAALPQELRAKYTELAKSLAKQYEVRFENKSDVPVVLTIREGDGNSGISKVVVPGGQSHSRNYPPWSGEVDFSFVAQDHPEDYYETKGVSTIGGHGGRKTELLRLKSKPDPVLVVVNDGKLPISVSVGSGMAQTIPAGGEARFSGTPRTPATVVAKAYGVPAEIANIVEPDSREVSFGGRGTTQTVKFEVLPNWARLESVKSLAAKDAILEFAKAKADRDLLKARFSKMHDKQLGALKTSMGEPELWQSAKRVSGTFAQFVLVFDFLLELDPDEATIKEAEFLKGCMAESSRIMEFFDQDDDKRARWNSFVRALDKALIVDHAAP